MILPIALRQLEIFAETARQGNLTLAAERMCMTQSAASMSLKTLERALGGPLFNRVGRGLMLNDRGRMLLPYADATLAKAGELVELARDEGEEPVGRIIVGCSTTIANYLFPGRIKTYLIAHPQVDVALRVGNTLEVAQLARSGQIDLGLIEGEIEGADLEEENWLRDELVVIASPDHRLARAGRITPKDILKEKWLLREKGSGTLSTVEHAMLTQGLKPPQVSEIGGTEAIKRAVEAGMGLSWLSRIAVERESAAGTLVILRAPMRVPRWFRMLRVSGRYQSRLVRHISAWLRAMRPEKNSPSTHRNKSS